MPSSPQSLLGDSGAGVDWRLRQLRSDPLLNPGFLASIHGRTWWRGYIVIRPGVPNWQARRSVHLTRRRAAVTVEAWNAEVCRLNEANEPMASLHRWGGAANA